MSNTDNFKQRVCDLVARIPEGRVMTYSQIAALCGSPRAARIVGGVAHYGDESLPWHRVVKSSSKLAEGYYGGVEGHRLALEAEGIEVRDDYTIVNFEEHLWDEYGKV